MIKKLKEIKIQKITPINIEWNEINGFCSKILDIDINSRECSLFGLSFSKNYIHLELLFMTIFLYENYD